MRLAAAAILLSMAMATGAFAQGPRFREGRIPPRFAPPQMPDASMTICRLAYRSTRSEAGGIGWLTDYPFAEMNLLTRLSELTKTPVSRDDRHRPNSYVVRPTDPTLFNCPMLVASDVGTIGLEEEDLDPLRTYLLKGGFLWVDDFWGTPAWRQWSTQIGRVLPPSEYPISDIPSDDPVLRTMFSLTHVPQVTNIQFWRGVDGTTTSERGADSAQVDFRAIRDKQGRIMVLMTHNTDLGDSWEREGEDPGYFYQFSPDGYAVGIDVLLYVLTH